MDIECIGKGCAELVIELCIEEAMIASVRMGIERKRFPHDVIEV